MSDLLSAALRYAELGYPVFPCEPGTNRPATAHGFKDATTDPARIERWWAEIPRANIGMPTTGLLVLDIDGASNPWPGPDRAMELTIGPMAITPRGGNHRFYRQPAEQSWRSTQSTLAPSVDTRADGGYVVLPPSRRAEGAYRWVDGLELDEPYDRLPEPPAWLQNALKESNSQRETNDPTERETIASRANQIPSGQRNAALARLAGTMRRVGMSEPEIFAALERVNTDRCVPPLPIQEVRGIAGSLARYQPDQISVALIEDHWGQMQAKKREETKKRFPGITSAQLDSGEYNLEYLIDGLLVRGQPGVIAGPKKTLKTSISIDLAISLGQGSLFLSHFPVTAAVRVGVMSGESGAATIQETARRIAASQKQRLSQCGNVIWAFEVPQLGVVEHTEALRTFVMEHELEVLILDPTYLMMMNVGDGASNLFIVGALLDSLAKLSQETGCTPLLCHHLRKGIADPYEPAELDNIAWAGFQEFVRQWLLINRRSRYDPANGGHHELWLSSGGSAGHSGLWGIDIEEGTRQGGQQRRWEVSVMSGQQVIEDREMQVVERQEQRQEVRRMAQSTRHQEVVWKAICSRPEGETRKALRLLARLNSDRFEEVLEELMQDGRVESCSVIKGGRTFEGVRPRASDPADPIGPK